MSTCILVVRINYITIAVAKAEHAANLDNIHSDGLRAVSAVFLWPSLSIDRAGWVPKKSVQLVLKDWACWKILRMMKRMCEKHEPFRRWASHPHHPLRLPYPRHVVSRQCSGVVLSGCVAAQPDRTTTSSGQLAMQRCSWVRWLTMETKRHESYNSTPCHTFT